MSEMPEPPTWRDIETLGLSSPVVHQAVRAVERGLMDREEALMRIVFALAKSERAVFKQLLDEIDMRNRPLVIQR